MSTPNSSSAPGVWPLPAFSFQVSFGTLAKIPFQEVTGLDTETQVIEYRHSNRPDYSTIKLPGLKKIGSVTLKRGLFVDSPLFWTWYDQISMNTISRLNVVIQLLDESSQPVMTWTLLHAWPTKITAPTLKSDGNEVAIETIELAHEGFTIGSS